LFLDDALAMALVARIACMVDGCWQASYRINQYKGVACADDEISLE
jgi:hypothetical protein